MSGSSGIPGGGSDARRTPFSNPHSQTQGLGGAPVGQATPTYGPGGVPVHQPVAPNAQGLGLQRQERSNHGDLQNLSPAGVAPQQVTDEQWNEPSMAIYAVFTSEGYGPKAALEVVNKIRNCVRGNGVHFENLSDAESELALKWLPSIVSQLGAAGFQGLTQLYIDQDLAQKIKQDPDKADIKANIEEVMLQIERAKIHLVPKPPSGLKSSGFFPGNAIQEAARPQPAQRTAQEVEVRRELGRLVHWFVTEGARPDSARALAEALENCVKGNALHAETLDDERALYVFNVLPSILPMLQKISPQGLKDLYFPAAVVRKLQAEKGQVDGHMHDQLTAALQILGSGARLVEYREPMPPTFRNGNAPLQGYSAVDQQPVPVRALEVELVGWWVHGNTQRITDYLKGVDQEGLSPQQKSEKLKEAFLRTPYRHPDSLKAFLTKVALDPQTTAEDLRFYIGMCEKGGNTRRLLNSMRPVNDGNPKNDPADRRLFKAIVEHLSEDGLERSGLLWPNDISNPFVAASRQGELQIGLGIAQGLIERSSPINRQSTVKACGDILVFSLALGVNFSDITTSDALLAWSVNEEHRPLMMGMLRQRYRDELSQCKPKSTPYLTVLEGKDPITAASMILKVLNASHDNAHALNALHSLEVNIPTIIKVLGKQLKEESTKAVRAQTKIDAIKSLITNILVDPARVGLTEEDAEKMLEKYFPQNPGEKSGLKARFGNWRGK